MPPFRRLENSKIGFPGSPEVAPPDLAQSVEEVYRSFLSDSADPSRSLTTSHSTSLLTPESEVNQFSFSGTGEDSRVESSAGDRPVTNEAATSSSTRNAVQLGEYAAHAACQFAELGYMEPPMLLNEVERRRAARSFKPFNRKLDPNLDRIARIGKSMFAANASLISLVDAHEVQLSFDGNDPYMVPRGTPMCSHTVLLENNEPFVVLDTLLDWRFKSNRVVTDELDIRFYAGVPIRDENGRNIGVFCILDNKPRKQFSREDLAQLKELSVMTMRELHGCVQHQETALREQMQSSMDAFNHDAVSGSYSADQLLHRAVDYIGNALSMEGVLLFDAINAGQGKPPLGKQRLWQDRNGAPIPVLASSEHAKLLSGVGRQDSAADILFQEYRDGLIYVEGDEISPIFMKLLPEGVTAAAAVPVSCGPNKPFALICVYTLRGDFHFRLPKQTLSFLRNLGLVLCSVQQKRALSQADKAKVDFIANISHELRTPLHGVMASCDLLGETTLSDTQESFLSTAKQCASSLTETINHVLDFTKSASQSVGQKRSPVDLAQLVEETLVGCWWGRTVAETATEALPVGEIYAPQSPPGALLDKKGSIEPIIDIEPIPNWVVMLDKAGLRRILINLIGNSMKFTQDGYVKVGLYRGVQTDSSVVPIEIVVEDTGLGMSETFVRERLFHPFSQERPFAQGIGLGLAIVRSILKSPGIDGTVEVHSQIGFGTRMVVGLQAPSAVQSPGLTWARNPVPLDPTKPLTFALIGFPEESRGTSQLATLLRQHLKQWYGDTVETDPSRAAILIVNGDIARHSVANSVQSRQQKIFVLSSSPVDPTLLTIAQQLTLNGGFCLVALKPVGPHALARSLSKMVDPLMPNSPTAVSPVIRIPPSDGSPINMPQRHLSPRLSPTPTSTLGRKTIFLPPEALESVEQPHDAKPRALVVEDNPVNRKVLAAYLRKRNFDFEEAENGEDGVRLFNQRPAGYFDICLMDLQMPALDGFQATFDIRQIETRRVAASISHEGFNSRLKVYALSGLASSEDKERASSLGFDGYFVKPVSLKTLDAVFRSLPPIARWRGDI